MNFSVLRWLRHASMLEGCTLLGLVGIAVPLKYLGDMPWPVSVVGPIHGAAFLAFLVLLLASLQAMPWTRTELFRLTIGAFLPFGAFFNAGLLQRKTLALQAALDQTDTPD